MRLSARTGRRCRRLRADRYVRPSPSRGLESPAMLTSYHNHTNWSDGAPTLAAQIQAAKAAGLDELGISDHYVLLPDRRDVEWSMPLDMLGEYVLQICSAAHEVRGLVLRLGIEADFIPETVDELRERLAPHPWDYIIGSVHSVDGFP